jgi:hypothetical protein
MSKGLVGSHLVKEINDVIQVLINGIGTKASSQLDSKRAINNKGC